jgi:hypothetical protein
MDIRVWTCCRGVAMVLALAPPLPAGLVGTLSFWAARDKVNQPLALAALQDGHYLLLDRDREGIRRLMHLEIVKRPDQDLDWKLYLCLPPPEDAAGLFAGGVGTGERCFLLRRNGDLSCCLLRKLEQGLALVAEGTPVDGALREAAGVGSALPGSCVELADGSLVLGYRQGVLLVAPATSAEGKAAQGQGPGAGPGWRWLVTAPGAANAPEGVGLLAAADRSGRVLVLDPAGRRLLRVDPGTGAEETLATGAVWPRGDLVPEQMCGHGDTLYVAARMQAEPGLRTLVVLEPGAPGEARTYRAYLPFIGMDGRSTFTVSSAGHVLVSEPWAGGVRWIPNLELSAEARQAVQGSNAMPYLDRMLVTALLPAKDLIERCIAQAGAQPSSARQALKPKPESKAAPDPAGQAKADQAFQELMAQEQTQAQDQDRQCTRRARKKAYQQRRREKRMEAAAVAGMARSSVAQAKPGNPCPAAAARAEPAAPAPASPSRLGRSRSAPAILEQGVAAEPGPAPGLPAAPAGAEDRWTLDQAARERAVQWMLQHTDQANPAKEYWAWRLAGGAGRPRFSYGLYQRPDPDGRVLVQVRYLWAFARAIDGADGSLLAEQLAASGGITGFRTQPDGTWRPVCGLEVILDAGCDQPQAVRPGGAPLATGPGAAEPESKVPAGMGAQPPAGVPGRRKSVWNVHAPVFVMPGE